MDWSASMEMYSNVKPEEDGSEEAEDDEDFYGYNNPDDSHAYVVNCVHGIAPLQQQMNTGAAMNLTSGLVPLDKNIESAPPPKTPSNEQKKAENQKIAETLRAKLLARRQNTPSKDMSREQTPSKAASATQEAPILSQTNGTVGHADSSSDPLGLESLLAEGKANAKAKMEKLKLPAQVANGVADKSEHPQAKPTGTGAGEDAFQTPLQTSNRTEQFNPPSHLNDVYYADLAIWLEFTGYHDVEFRTSKLRNHKERKVLEEEAARIAERLEKLKEQEAADMQSLRPATAHQTPASQRPPPALPATVPDQDSSAKQTPALKPISPVANGTKRAHSPGPVASGKAPRRREESAGFRIRGANDSPEARQTAARRVRSPIGLGLERRISYPDVRRRSFADYERNGNRSRDPSLERRKAYYKQDGRSTAAPGYERDGRLERPDIVPRGQETRGRQGFGAEGRAAAGPGYAEYLQQYRGSAGLELHRGDVRYFMIKSWNHQNVEAAMRDGLWATQVKNEQLLTEAFHTSRHVILLFSVNKSMQFQGYALMTSAPDTNLPKPSFCAKLNWGTSPAFTLHWLSTTPVHFKYIGHIKNELNRDEHGEPMAVLIGKDGQEITSDAGGAVVQILDDAEKVQSKHKVAW